MSIVDPSLRAHHHQSSDFEAQVFERLKKLLSKRGITKIAVGVSGGADSLALLMLVRAYLKTLSCKGHSLKLIALTVDHGLRPESADEARQVGEIVRAQGIEHVILTWQGGKPTSGFQEKARFARHRLLRKYCQQEGWEALLLAHHLDDQEETLLMRFLRQSRLRGLSGMSALSHNYDWPEGVVVRPLLSFRKKALTTYLISQKISWIEDPSNKNLIYDRVRTRHFLAHHRPWILNFLPSFERIRMSYDKIMTDLIQQGVTFFLEGYALIERKKWDALPRPFQQDLLESVVMAIGGHYYPPRRKNLESLCHRLRTQKKGRLSFGGCLLHQGQKHYKIIREPKSIAAPRCLLDGLAQEDPFVWDHRFRWVLEPATLDLQRLKGVTVGGLGHNDYLVFKKEGRVSPPRDWPATLIQTFPTFRKGADIICVPFLDFASESCWDFLSHSLLFDPIQPAKRHFLASESLLAD